MTPFAGEAAAAFDQPSVDKQSAAGVGFGEGEAVGVVDERGGIAKGAVNSDVRIIYIMSNNRFGQPACAGLAEDQRV